MMTSGKMKLERMLGVQGKIVECERKGHVQQVAFSAYHHAFTQVCFTCGVVRTNLSRDDEFKKETE